MRQSFIEKKHKTLGKTLSFTKRYGAKSFSILLGLCFILGRLGLGRILSKS